MKLLTFAWSIATAAWLCLPAVFAQVPPAEQLLPDDTIAVITVPDWSKLNTANSQSPWGQLWADPAMKPFRDNFNSNFQADFIKPLEKELGVSLTDYQDLLQGQLTLALVPPAEGSTDMISFLVLLDSKDKSDQLTAKLAELKKKWTDAGKELQTEKIRDIEFNTISLSGEDVQGVLKKAFPGSAEDEEAEEETEEADKDAAAPAEKQRFRIGQYKSLLILGENPKAIEKLLARQTGGLVPPLGEKAEYQKSHNLMFRDSLAHVWVNVKPIYEKVLQMASQEREAPPAGMPGLQPDKILPALGLASIDSISAKLGGGNDGSIVEFMLGVPDARREGIFKLLTLEKKDAAPPAFVPADAVKFQRTRIDAQKSFATLEGILSKIDPSMAGFLQLMLSSAGKDKDPNFDLKKNLIGNLGDDFIQYQKAPKGAKLADLASFPSVTLIGSPDPAGLLDALRMITSLMPPPISTAPLKEREFLGKKIYTLSMAAAPGTITATEDEDEDDNAGAPPAVKTQTLSFTSSAGYLAVSTDDSLLEDYLRSGENPPKPLRGTPGFAEAAQKAGGMENGFFSFENQAETTRITLEAFKNDPEALSAIPFLNMGGEDGEASGIGRLFNIKLLPSFDRIAKYFGIAVASAGTTADGFYMKAVAPKPNGLK